MLCLILFSLIFPALINASLVQIDQGVLNGDVLKSRNGDTFDAFYGIPYAQPPVGELRFEPPASPAPSWQGTREANQKPAECAQYNFWLRNFIGSEDCLFLHVFTRNVKPATLAPVIVFFHGGGFTTGSGTMLGPQYFMDKPIVLVTVNYRLGVFGFFSSGDPSYPGNYGLKDQVVALKWIQKNIRAFGGDPNVVTIMGQSSGAAGVNMHAMSPLSKGLFHRAIVMSAAAIHPISFSPQDEVERKYWQFQSHALCLRPTVRESVACLKNIPTQTLTELDQSFSMQNFKNGFKPVIEAPVNEGAFLTTNPNKLVYYSQVPMIFGFTSNEAGARNPEAAMIQNLKDENSFYSVLPGILLYRNPYNPLLEYNITSLIKKLYFGDDLANLDVYSASMVNMHHPFRQGSQHIGIALNGGVDKIDPNEDLLSDIRFKMGIVETAKTYPGVKYTYEYDYRSLESTEPGVPHSEDMKNFFPFQFDASVLNDEQRKLSEILITYWCNFASSGNPNTPDAAVPTQWDSVATNSVEFLHISNNGLKMEKDVTHGKAQFWQYYQYSQKSNII